MAPSISIRESIRWLPDAPSEPTSTVVLTSAESRFVDLRILKPVNKSVQDDDKSDDAVLHTDRLDWAFAGTSSSEVRTKPDGSKVIHSTWQHWVDSRTNDPEKATDEGDMFPQANGTTLETGNMVNPATGRKTDYEEIWLDEEPICTDPKETKRQCAVLQLHDDANQSRGMVVRVGQFCQGYWKAGGESSLERWKWEESGGWKRTVRMGNMWLPCGVVLEGKRLSVEGEVKFGEFVWKVVELSEF